MRPTQPSLFAAALALVLAAAAPAFAQGNGFGSRQGENKSVGNWNTNAFSKTPPANTNAFSKTPPANTNAFSKTPPANTNAFGTENGGKVTAFGSSNRNGPPTNAFSNEATASNNKQRLSNAFGTTTDQGASPIGPHTGPQQRAIGGGD